MKIKFLAILSIFLLLFTSCGKTPPPEGNQVQDETQVSHATPDKINDSRYAGTLDKISEDFLDITSDGEQNRFATGERTLRDIESLGITEGSRVIVEFETVDGDKRVTGIEKIVSE